MALTLGQAGRKFNTAVEASTDTGKFPEHCPVGAGPGVLKYPIVLQNGHSQMDVLERIRQQVEENPIILYMKGTPDFPQCGFSARTVQVLNNCGVEYAYVNIYEDEEIYRALPKFANWPTFPQLYVKGELVGGCDITLDLYQSGELKKMLEEAVAKKQAA